MYPSETIDNNNCLKKTQRHIEKCCFFNPSILLLLPVLKNFREFQEYNSFVEEISSKRMIFCLSFLVEGSKKKEEKKCPPNLC